MVLVGVARSFEPSEVAADRQTEQDTVEMVVDRWLPLPEIAKMLGLSEGSIRRLGKKRGLPLRRVTPYATPGALETELFEWLKAQPMIGGPVRPAGRGRRSRAHQRA